MNSSNDPNSKPPLEPMPPVLFPVRTFHGSESDATAFSEMGDYTSAPGNGKAEVSSVHWLGMSPLEMVETLAATTEQRESLEGKTPETPIVIDDVKLSSKVPVAPVPNEEAAPSIDTIVCKPEIEESHKRRKLLDGFVSTQEVQPQFLAPFDPSFIQERDGHTVAAVGRILFLARTLESMPTFQDVAISYGRARDYLSSTYHSIQHIYAQPSFQERITGHVFEKRVQLENLFYETIQKLEELIDMARKHALDKAAACKIVFSHLTENPSTVSPDPTPVAESKQPLNKSEFTSYMMNWLRDNWVNPYPDEPMLEKMASECGTPSTVVSNWLINARTRKWRPAIAQAYEMQRPAQYLIEDSINVFDGKPVRPLPPGVQKIQSSPLALGRGKRKSR